MPNFTADEYQRLVKIVATSVGSDFARARYLVDTAARVMDVMAGKPPGDAVTLFAICLHTFGATTSPVYTVRSTVPALPDPDPEKLEAVRVHLGTSEDEGADEDEQAGWAELEEKE